MTRRTLPRDRRRSLPAGGGWIHDLDVSGDGLAPCQHAGPAHRDLLLLGGQGEPALGDIRFLLRGPDRRPVPAAQLRLLAQIIGAHPQPRSPDIGLTARLLQRLAGWQKGVDVPLVVTDWSHRTDPQRHGPDLR
jgi:hypothetical protein